MATQPLQVDYYLKMSRFGYGKARDEVHEDDCEEDMALGEFKLKGRKTLEKEEELRRARLKELMTCPLCKATHTMGEYSTCRCLQHDTICPSCHGSWHYCRLDGRKMRTGHPCDLNCGDFGIMQRG